PRALGRLQGAPSDLLHRRPAPQRGGQGGQVPTGDGRRVDCRDLMAGNSTIVVERLDRVTRITLNRPDQHNPLTPRCMREILRAVEEAEADEEVRVLIIRSSGRSFSSGYGYVAEDVEEGDFAQHGSIEDDVSAMIGLGSKW